MNFDPNDLHGILPALILSVGALLLLTSEVFLRGVRPKVLGPGVGAAGTAQRALPPGAESKPDHTSTRYSACVRIAYGPVIL